MPRILFSDLPSASRLWIFPAERPLTSEEEERLLSRIDAYLESWRAHGAPLTCARDWRYGRFLLVGVDEASEPPTGCSIDGMTKVLKRLGAELGMTFVDRAPVMYRDGDEIRRVSRAEFKAKAQAGELTLDTTVFDNSIIQVSELKEGKWETPARESWHGRVFWGNS